MNYLTVENLKKSYTEKILFQDITFYIDKGQKVAFVAQNGTGKTTMMTMLTWFLPPTSGDAFLDNHKIYENESEIWNRIGYQLEYNSLHKYRYAFPPRVSYLNFSHPMFALESCVKSWTWRNNEAILNHRPFA